MNKPEQEMKLYPVEPEIIRFKLATQFPYFNGITYRIKPRMIEGLRTFGVTPNWVWVYGDLVPMTEDEQVAALFHEINHLLRNHAGREGDRGSSQDGHEKWNWAGDFEINDWWPPKLTPPEWILKPDKFKLPDGELAEWYFANMPESEYHVREDANAVSPGTGACTTDGCDSQDVAPIPGNIKTGALPVRGKFHGPVCGSSHNGDTGSGDSDEADGSGVVGELEAEAVRHGVAKDIEEAAKNDKTRGNIPGGMIQWAHDLLNPQISWQKHLRTIVRKQTVIINGQQDTSWARPRRKTIPPFILPRKIAHKAIPAMYIDTSGSMSDEEIAQALSEVRAAVKANASFIYVTTLDAAVYPTVRVNTSGDMPKVKVEHRGGTDMRLLFEHYKTLRPRPNLLVCFTDGETPWPDEEPEDARTIIVLTQPQNKAHYPTPPWAKVLEVTL